MCHVFIQMELHGTFFIVNLLSENHHHFPKATAEVGIRHHFLCKKFSSFKDFFFIVIQEIYSINWLFELSKSLDILKCPSKLDLHKVNDFPGRARAYGNNIQHRLKTTDKRSRFVKGESRFLFSLLCLCVFFDI